ncbi:leucine-rich repeat-containing protein 74A-like [Ruditapes philippinarum]|uniref:leucine-rich repeat-containing protein 74A-like n=1 Tax=Ruditapes philippinarum TaxID=129788 RepID=UPI00295B9BCC|nr:leucine-rich repeat-containing protein 74A-like [Ruditapes philippinarum]
MTLDSDGRSSQMSYLNDLHENENFFKENYDFDGEEPEEPPRYPHLVHTPGTYTQELYLKACKRFQIPHSSFFYKHLLNDTIVLKRQRLGPIGMKACAIALVETLNVHTLDVTDNNLGPDGARYLAELISENNFLKHLNVSSNALGEEGVRILADAIKKTDSLESLDISDNGLGDMQAEAVRPIIEDTNNLKILILSHNELRDEGGKLIGDALLWSDTIQHLDLSWNKLHRRGAIKVAEALVKNTSITSLDLSWNGLHMEGITALGKALEKNNTLTELNISDNRINRACLDKLCTSLRKNTTLKTLHIKKNPLTHEDAIVVLRFLQDNPSSGITCLDLSEICVDENFLAVLDELRSTRELTVHHGKLRGHDMSIQDNDEGLLLKEDSWHVLEELSYVLGVNIVKLLIGISDELRCGLTPDDMVNSLKILKNPLSDKCSEILVKRLNIDAKGFVDFSSKRAPNKRKPSANLRRRLSVIETLQEIGSMIEEDNNENNSEEDEPKEKVPVNASERIRRYLFRVMTRRMSGSSVYRRDVEIMSQDGETMLKYQIIDMLRQSKLSKSQKNRKHRT